MRLDIAYGHTPFVAVFNTIAQSRDRLFTLGTSQPSPSEQRSFGNVGSTLFPFRRFPCLIKQYRLYSVACFPPFALYHPCRSPSVAYLPAFPAFLSVFACKICVQESRFFFSFIAVCDPTSVSPCVPRLAAICLRPCHVLDLLLFPLVVYLNNSSPPSICLLSKSRSFPAIICVDPHQRESFVRGAPDVASFRGCWL